MSQPEVECCTGCGGPLGDEVWLPVDQLVTDESVFCSSACALARQKELTTRQPVSNDCG